MKLKDLLKESNAPGFENRQFGDSLPTLASTQAAYEAKQGKVQEDYSTMQLKSNIDKTWISEQDMINDLTQWISSVSAASSTGLGDGLINALETVVQKLR